MEFYIYGSQRLGYLEDGVFLGRKCKGKFCNIGALPIGNMSSVSINKAIPISLPSVVFPKYSTNTLIYFGKKRYEMNDWLGNVRVVINDRKTPINSGTTTVGYRSQVMSVRDYYSFGGEMAERSYDPVKPYYRFGFNSHERLDEVYGKGNVLSFGDYGYDTRIGRRWNVDKEFKKFPNHSPYLVFSGNPLIFVDISGNADFYFNGKWIGTDNRNDNMIVIVRDKQIKTQIKRGDFSAFEKGFSEGFEKGRGFVAIHADILKESYVILNESLKNGTNKEFLAAMTKKGNRYEKFFSSESVEQDLTQGKIIGGIMPEKGDVSIHSHPTGFAIVDEIRNGNLGKVKYAYSAGMPSEEDKKTFEDFKINIIVGKNGDGKFIENINGFYRDQRIFGIFIFDKSANRIGFIEGKEAKKIIHDYNKRKGDKDEN